MHGFAGDMNAVRAAVAQGDVRALTRAQEEDGLVLSVDLMAHTAQLGQLEVMQHLRLRGCGWDARVCAAAARGGALACLRFAREHGCAWNAQTCAMAAAGGHLDCLTYAHENGCPWDAGTCTAAIRERRMNCLRYACFWGCPWDRYTWHAAHAWDAALELAHECGFAPPDPYPNPEYADPAAADDAR